MAEPGLPTEPEGQDIGQCSADEPPEQYPCSDSTVALADEHHLFYTEELESIVKSSFQDITEDDATFKGTLQSRDEFNYFLENLKVMGYEFSVRHSRKFEWTPKSRLLFKWTINNLPIEKNYPFRIVSYSTMQCSLGGVYKSFESTHKRKSPPPNSKPKIIKKRLRAQPTRKLGCMAYLTIKEIEGFPDYIYSDESFEGKRQATTKLRDDMENKTAITRRSQFFVAISKHHNHLSTQGLRIHPEIVKEIRVLAESGVTSVKEIRTHLEQFANSHFESSNLKPDPSNSAFYPSRKAVYFHLCQAIFRMKKSKMDQDALHVAIEEWMKKSTDFFFFRPYSEQGDVSSDTLLFCHQTVWQKELIIEYGNSMCLLDATFKTTKYSLPLFFIVVKTNVMYQIVGTFLIQVQTGDCITEALNIFKTWNLTWQPKFWMMPDYSEVEINGIETVFPESRIYLCRFYVEQDWMTWLEKTENAGGNSEAIFGLFRAVADSKTESELETALDNLNESEITKAYPQVMEYFNSTWMSVKQLWIKMFIDREYSSSDIESKNRDLKYGVLQNSEAATSLTEMLKNVLNEYLPRLHTSYKLKTFKNLTGDRSGLCEFMPEYLLDKPEAYVKHIMARLITADMEYSEASIVQIKHGLFNVKSSIKAKKFHPVDFLVHSCTCADFKKYPHVCKHFAAIFLNVPGWSYDNLPEEYKSGSFNELSSGDPEQQPIIITAEPASKKMDETVHETKTKRDRDDQSTDRDVPLKKRHQEIRTAKIGSISAKEKRSECTPTQEGSKTDIFKRQQKLRELLKSIHELSYKCKDVKILDKTIQMAQKACTNIEDSVEKDTPAGPPWARQYPPVSIFWPLPS